MNTCIPITDSNFKQEVEESIQPVLVDFWSKWCQPCKSQTPIIEKISKEYAGKVKVCKMEVGDNPDTPARLQILSIPAIALFQNGKCEELKLGMQNKASLKKMLEHEVH